MTFASRLVNQIFVGLLLLFLSGSLLAKEVTIPSLNAPVMDTADMMSIEARNDLNQALLQYEQHSGSQIVVLTIPELKHESPFQYGARVMDKWQLGRKNIDDGVLLLIVRDNRQMQLLIGRGLEGAIPDAYAKRILDEIVTPAFQRGDIDKGIEQAVAQIEKLIAGEELPEKQPQIADSDPIETMMFIGMAVWIFSQFLSMFLGRFFAAFFSGTVGFIGAWWLTTGFLNGLVLGVILFILVLSGVRPSHFGGHGGGRGGSSGGFGGGGGRYGGGGASGRW